MEVPDDPYLRVPFADCCMRVPSTGLKFPAIKWLLAVRSSKLTTMIQDAIRDTRGGDPNAALYLDFTGESDGYVGILWEYFHGRCNVVSPRNFFLLSDAQKIEILHRIKILRELAWKYGIPGTSQQETTFTRSSLCNYIHLQLHMQ